MPKPEADCMNEEKELNTENWWKWGDPSQSFHLDQYPKLKSFLEEKWERKLYDDFGFPSWQARVPRTGYSQEKVHHLFPGLNLDQIQVDPISRLKHGLGKSYHDTIRSFVEESIDLPAFVLLPETEEDIQHILAQAAKHQLRIVPFGGGSSVTGGLQADHSKGDAFTLSLQRMNQLLEFDPESHTAVFQPGAYGPDIEKMLNKRGFTLGHFPQSFEFSTIGGWAATRSAGQESGRYGKIEDMIQALWAVTPRGIIGSQDFPRHANGIDLHRLFLGSEGTLGIITRIKVKIQRKPKDRIWVSAVFRSFEDGMNAIREMIQQGFHPAITRLSDEDETRLYSLLSSHEPAGIERLIRNWMKSRLKNKGYGKPAVLMVMIPVEHEVNKAEGKAIRMILKKKGGALIPASTAENWEASRFSLPYLKDTLIQHRILIDTFETITSWHELKSLYDHIRSRLGSESNFFDSGGLLLCHISHIYLTGASLYFTMLAPQEKGNEVDQWKAYKEVVTQAIFEKGAAVSHHHGIGKDHQQWYLHSMKKTDRALLKAIKQHLDPDHLLNPNKLFDEPEQSNS